MQEPRRSSRGGAPIPPPRWAPRPERSREFFGFNHRAFPGIDEYRDGKLSRGRVVYNMADLYRQLGLQLLGGLR